MGSGEGGRISRWGRDGRGGKRCVVLEKCTLGATGGIICCVDGEGVVLDVDMVVD